MWFILLPSWAQAVIMVGVGVIVIIIAVAITIVVEGRASTDPMSVESELPLVFARVWHQYAQAHPQLQGKFEQNDKEGHTSVVIPRQSDKGFDITLRCCDWYVFVRAGPWEDVGFEYVEITPSDVCEQAFASVRVLLSPDAYILLRRRWRKRCSYHLRIRRPGGWETWGRGCANVFPSGESRRVVLQNRLLPRRWPYGTELLEDLDLPRWEPGV